MSRSSAQRYSTAARLSVEFPELVKLVERGELHMSTLVSLRHHVTKENVSDLIALSRGRSRYEVEELLLDLAPRPDAPSRMRKIPSPRNEHSTLPFEFEQSGITFRQNFARPLRLTAYAG